MKRSINKTKWKKIKKSYERIRQTMMLDEDLDTVLVFHVYKKKDKGQQGASLPAA